MQVQMMSFVFPSEVAAAWTLETLDWVDTLRVTLWFVRFVYLLCIN